MHPYKYKYNHIFNTNTYKNNFNNAIPALWKLKQENCFKFEVYIASRRPVWATKVKIHLGGGGEKEKEREKGSDKNRLGASR